MRQTLPNTLLHTPDSSLPFAGGKSTWHRRTNEKTKRKSFEWLQNSTVQTPNRLQNFDFHQKSELQERAFISTSCENFFFSFSALGLSSNKLYVPWTLTLNWQNFAFCDGSTAVKITVWLPSMNSCGEVTAGDAETVARSLSVALTGSQDTKAVVLPLSAYTVCGNGQDSPNEGFCVSYAK